MAPILTAQKVWEPEKWDSMIESSLSFVIHVQFCFYIDIRPYESNSSYGTCKVTRAAVNSVNSTLEPNTNMARVSRRYILATLLGCDRHKPAMPKFLITDEGIK